MRLILLTLLAPAKAAERIKTNPQWVLGFLSLSVVSVLTYAFLHPYLVQETLASLPSTSTDADKRLLLDSFGLDLPARLLFLPLRLFIGWGTFSLALFYVVKAFTTLEPIRLRQALSTEVHAEATSVSANLLILVLTLASPDGRLAKMPLGLTELIEPRYDLIIQSLFTTFNIFTLWYIVILTIAISTLSKLGKLKSLLIVLMVWTFSTLLNLGAMKLLKDELHLLL